MRKSALQILQYSFVCKKKLLVDTLRKVGIAFLDLLDKVNYDKINIIPDESLLRREPVP